MAPFLKCPLLAIFFLVMLLFSNPIEAREIKIPTTEAPSEAPVPSPIRTERGGYEYYGHETGFLPPQKKEEELAHEELGDNNNNGNGYLVASENYVSGDQSSKRNDYRSERQGMSDTSFMEGCKYYFNVGGQPENKARDGNTKSQRYVYDTMEEYEQYEENQHYVP